MPLTNITDVMSSDVLLKYILDNVNLKYALLNNDIASFKKITDVSYHGQWERMRKIIREHINGSSNSGS